MIRKRLGVGLSLIAMLSAGCLVSASWTAARSPVRVRVAACRHGLGARVVASTDEIVVYRAGGESTGERLSACVRASGAIVSLYNGAWPVFPSTVSQISARGDYVGFVVLWHGVDTSGTDAEVVDVATGEWEVAAADGAKQLVLGPAGSAAWTVPGAVLVSDAFGQRTVAHGPRIFGHSLSLRGVRLSWRDAKARRSTLLHPIWDGRCASSDSVTVLDARSSRVYYAYAGSPVGYYSCLRGTGAVTSMLTGGLLRARYPHGSYGRQSAFDYFNGLAVSGEYGAIANDGWPDGVLRLYDLSTTQLVFTTHVHRIDSLVVGRCGAMAWTQTDDAFYDIKVRSSVYVYTHNQVRIVDHGLRTYFVDFGAGGGRTDDDTLAISGHTLRWIHNGRHKAVPVC